MSDERNNGSNYSWSKRRELINAAFENQRALAPPLNEISSPDIQAGVGAPQRSIWMIWREILRRWRHGFLVCTALGLLGGLLVTALRTPMYQGRALMEIEDLNEDFLNMKQVTPVRESGPWDSITDLQTQVKTLQSGHLLEHALRRLDADVQDIDSWHPPISTWSKFWHVRSPERAADLSSPELLARRVKARIVPQTKDVEVLVEASNPRLAAALANAICQEFVQENVEARWNLSRQTGEWLDELLKDMRAKLARSEAALQRYAESAGLVFNSDQKSVSNDKLHQIQDELTRARAEREEKQARFELAAKSPDEALPEVLDDKSLADYQAKLTDLRRQAAEISTAYTPEYSKLKKLQAQIATLEDSIRQQRQDVLQRIQNEYWAAARRESLLENDYNAQSRSVSLEAEKGVQYNVLQREVEGNRQAYDAMLQRVQEATIAAGMRASNVRMVDPALPSKAPYRPNVILNSIVGLFSGMILGGVYVLVRDSTDSSFRQPGDGTQYLKVAELGFIVHVDTKKGKALAASARPLLAGSGWRGGRPVLVSGFEDTEAAMVADSFRGILTSLRFSTGAADRPCILAVTSPGPREGKTTAVANLGMALAESKSRVLLIDGDLRRGQLSALLGASGTGGLLKLLQAAPDTNPLSYVEATGIPGLSVLGGDRTTIAAYPLLQSGRLPRILSPLKENFDIILIDTAPVLTAPDTRILGRSADGVILLVRAGKTDRQAALAAAQRLVDDGSLLLGTIFNDWDPKDSFGSYYGYYGKTYFSDKSERDRSHSTGVIHSNELPT